MICKEVMRKLEERWNPSYALEWDNVGLLVGREEKEIKEELASLHFLYENRQQQLEDMKNSASWRLTKPLRRLKGNKED